MERREGYEPVIVDLQKSTLVQQPKHTVPYAILSVGALLAVIVVALVYVLKPAPQPPNNTHGGQLPTTPTAVVVIAPTPVPTPKPSAPTPTVQATTTAESQTGLLTLYSFPENAEVLIGGKLIGRTPLRNYALAPGVYPVKFVYQGNISEQQIIVSAGRTTEFRYRFKGLATLTITTTSSGSDILINGKLAGQSPLMVDGLTPGVYQIVARKAGFATAEETVTLAANERRTILITIKRLDFLGP